MPIIDLRPYSEPHYMHYKYQMFITPILLDAHVIVETGFQDGTSTNIFLKALTQLGGGRTLHTYELTQSTDAPETIETRKKALMETQDRLHSDIWCYHTEDSVEGAKIFLPSHGNYKVDFLYLDSDHGLDHVYNELVEWSKHLSDKAWIMVDDAFDYDKQVSTGPMISSEKWMNEVNNNRLIIESPNGFKAPTTKEWKMLVFPEKHGPIVMYR